VIGEPIAKTVGKTIGLRANVAIASDKFEVRPERTFRRLNFRRIRSSRFASTSNWVAGQIGGVAKVGGGNATRKGDVDITHNAAPARFRQRRRSRIEVDVKKSSGPAGKRSDVHAGSSKALVWKSRQKT